MALACFIEDVDFRTFFRGSWASRGEYPYGSVDLILAFLYYNGRRDQNDNHANCPLFGLRDMRGMVKGIADVMKPVTNVHIF